MPEEFILYEADFPYVEADFYAGNITDLGFINTSDDPNVILLDSMIAGHPVGVMLVEGCPPDALAQQASFFPIILRLLTGRARSVS